MKKILIILLLLLFIAGCSDPNRYIYNGYTITKHEFGWAATVYANEQPHIVYLHHGPKELEDIQSENPKNKILDAKQIYATFSPSMPGAPTALAVIDLVKVTGTNPEWGIFKIPTKPTITEPDGINEVKTCNDASKEVTVILFKLGDKTKIYSENHCVIIESETEEDLIKASNRLVYELLGVIE
ncbi:hypothetical protein CL618_01990 [archaeon]|nr:hypothetical protein [archaeon]|tara:strand:+ start:658 stop:1209 length:552 start_codon:yes stop_codon:yes gene_type:complete